ncbi:MAG: flippase [Bacteroidota bacterium]
MRNRIQRGTLAFRRIFSDLHLRELIKHGAFNFGLRLLSGAIAFLFLVVLGRRLGPEGVGAYVLVLAVTRAVVVVARMGMSGALIRFIAAEAEAGRWDRVRGVFRQAFVAVSASALLLSAVLWVAGGALSSAFGVELRVEFRWIAVAVYPAALTWLFFGALSGLKRVREATFVQVLVQPMVTLPVFLLLAARDGAAPLDAVQAYVAGQGGAALLGAVLWLRARPAGPRAFEWGTLGRMALPFFWVNFLGFVDGWTATFALGVWGTSAEVGLYNAALRMALLTSYVLVGVNSIAAPKFAALHERGDALNVRRTAVNASRLMTVMAAPALVVFLVLPGWPLGLFGAEFVAAAPLLMLMALGQAVNVATGAVSQLLGMTGREKVLRNVTLVAVATNVVLTLILVPAFGATGAAVSTTASWMLFNVGCTIAVRYYLGYWVHCFASAPKEAPRPPVEERAPDDQAGAGDAADTRAASLTYHPSSSSSPS